VVLIFLTMIGSSMARKAERNKRCLIEVLHSEELAIAPLFSHTISATLLVTSP
jgi:hypothetical protein